MTHFSFLQPMTNYVRFEYVPWKMSNFVSFPLFGFTLGIKFRDFYCESHWNTLIFFWKRIYYLRLEYVLWKNVWFYFISIVWVHFSHKTEKVWFWKSFKCFNLFSKKIMWDLNMSCQAVYDLVGASIFE